MGYVMPLRFTRRGSAQAGQGPRVDPHITTNVEEEPILRIATLLGVDGENSVPLSSPMTLPDIVMSTGMEIY